MLSIVNAQYLNNALTVGEIVPTLQQAPKLFTMPTWEMIALGYGQFSCESNTP